MISVSVLIVGGVITAAGYLSVIQARKQRKLKFQLETQLLKMKMDKVLEQTKTFQREHKEMLNMEGK